MKIQLSFILLSLYCAYSQVLQSLFASATFVEVPIQNQIQLEDCGGSVAKLTSFEINPLPIKIGEEISYSVKGISNAGFTFEKVVLTAFKNGVPVGEYDFKSQITCNEACPFEFKNTLKVPRLPVQGLYTFLIKAYDSRNRNLLCTRSQVEMVKATDQLQNVIDFKTCKKEGAKGILQKLEFSEYPFILDTQVTFLLHIATKEEFTINNIRLTAYVENIPIVATSLGITSSCGKGVCLVQDNLFIDSKKVPEGKLDVEIKLQNAEDENLVCARSFIEIKKA